MDRQVVGSRLPRTRGQSLLYKVQFSEDVYKPCNAGGRSLEAARPQERFWRVFHQGFLVKAVIRYFGTKLKSDNLARSLHAVLFFYAATGPYLLEHASISLRPGKYLRHYNCVKVTPIVKLINSRGEKG